MSMFPIASYVATDNVGSITFSNIPQVFSHLQLRWYLRGSFAPGQAIQLGTCYVRANSDSSTIYVSHEIVANGSGVNSGSVLNDTVFRAQRCSVLANSAAGIYGIGIMDIHDYSSTTKFKTSKAMGGCDQNISLGGSAVLDSSVWRSTAAINSLFIFTDGDIVVGSRFDLYGYSGTVI